MTTSVFGSSPLILAIGSGALGVILIAALFVLCCGGMLFGMRGMEHGPTEQTELAKNSDSKTDDDQRKTA